jgi:iron complex outermembrane receptor protein
MHHSSKNVRRSTALMWGLVLLGAANAVLAEPVADASTDSANRASSVQIEEIVVSARRRDESLHDTPVAISAVSAAQLEDKGSTNIGDLQGAVPNLLITSQSTGANATNLSIRGLAFADIEKSFDPTVGVAIDGVFVGTSTGQLLDDYDLASIEVLRGPQGTLFGRNTIGGVINLTRTRPTGEWGGKFEIDYGSFNTLAYRGILNAPLIPEVLAGKFWYFENQSDGYYTNGITGRPAGGSYDRNFGAAFLFTPPGTQFDALLTVEKQIIAVDVVHSNLADSGDLFCLIGEPAGQCNRNYKNDLYTVFNSPGRADAQFGNVTLSMNWQLPGVKLTSVTGYRRSDEHQDDDFDSSSAHYYYATRVQPFHEFTEELRAAGKITNALDYVTGVYYYDHAYALDQQTLLGFLGTPAPITTFQSVLGTSQSEAVFADLNWNFIDQWRLNFGGRYTRDKKTLNNTDGGVFLGAPSATFDKFTPKVGIDYRPTSDYMFYASYSVGYRAGGFSNRAGDVFSTNTPFQPETVDSTEIGAKMEFFDKRLALNTAVFYSKYKDLQQSTTVAGGPTGNETIISNVGSATIKGVELEATAIATSYLSFSASLGTLSSKFNGFITHAPDGKGGLTTVDYSNVDPIYNPSITSNVSADLHFAASQGEIHANVGWRHIASYDQQISQGPSIVAPSGVIIVEGNDPRVHSPAQNLLDASLSRSFDLPDHTKWKMTIYGRNLLNDRGPASAFTVAGLWAFATAREPRSFGGKLDFQF